MSVAGNPENPSMQKKKYSPRNSPRGSPRPRASNSPRNTGSPRSSELPSAGAGARMPFLSAQDFASHLPGRSESQVGLQRSEQAKSPYNSEQRKSPFSQSPIPPYSSPSLSRAHFAGLPGIDIETRRDLLHSGIGGVDVARISPQCNNDNLAVLKSLEAYHNPHPQLRLSALAGTKDPVILQRKLEELRPIFQQLQQQAAQAQLAVPPATNGTDQPNSPSRSPVGTQLKGQVPTSLELHSAFDIAALRGNAHHNVASTTVVALPNDNSVNCVSTKVTKTVDEQKGTNVANVARRSSPGVANSVPFPYTSSLPLPKRLTESVQKLVKPLPLDNSLPHQKSRSPSSSASSVKQGSNNNSSTKANVRSSSSGHKTPVNDASHLDIDSITPSITGLCFDGPLDFVHPLPQISSPNLHEEFGPPPLQLTELTLSAGAILGNVSQASTTVVPAVTSSIPSHKTYTSDSATNSAFTSPSNSLSGGGVSMNTVSVSSAINSANVSTTSVCNSEAKMANLSAKEQTISGKPSLNSSGLGPPILHPYNARYPVLKHEEKPKSPYQQMGLSEMLQETANLHSISADRLPHNNSVSQKSTSCSHLNNASNQANNNSPVDETSELPIPVLSRQNSSASDSKLLNCDSNISVSEVNEIPSISKIANEKPFKNSSNSHPLASDFGKAVHSENTDLGPVTPNKSVFVSCGTCTPSVAVPSDIKALDPVKSETSQSKQDLSDSGQIIKDCDNLKDDETDCDKVNVIPSLVTTASEGKSNLSIVSSAAASACSTGLISNVSSNNDKANVVSELPESLESCDSSKSTKVRCRSHTSSEDSHEERLPPGDMDSAPRQLRSRKRTNTGESDGSVEDPSKKPKLETGSSLSVSNTGEIKQLDDSNTQTLIDTVKSGLRARTNIKMVHPEEKEKEKTKVVPGKESKKDVKTVTKIVPEKKVEPAKPEEIRKNSQSRRSRQSPSTVLEKPQNATGE